MDTIVKIATDRAERICNGQFPITYTREDVIKHSVNDFVDGYNLKRQEIITLKDVNELQELEDKLTVLISETDNEVLFTVFLAWMDKRNEMNSHKITELEAALNQASSPINP